MAETDNLSPSSDDEEKPKAKNAGDSNSDSKKSRDNRQSDEDSAPKKPSPLKNPKVRWALIIIGVIVLIALLIWLIHYWIYGRFLQSTNDAYLQADQVTVASRVAGFVDGVFVQDNQNVRVGQILTKVDERESLAKKEQAQAQVDQAKATVLQDQAQISQQQAQIAASEADLAAARAKYVYYENEAARYRPLAVSGAETVEKYDEMKQNRDQAQASMTENIADVASAHRKIDVLNAQLLSADAQIEQAKAQVRQADVDLDATTIRASISGRIADRTVRIGQYVQPGAPLMTVVPVQSIYVIANFKETQLDLMRVGQPAKISVDAIDGQELNGVVESFSPGTGAQFALIPPNNATGNFTKIVQRVSTRIKIKVGLEARKVLVPGMSVSVSVDTISAKSDRGEIDREDEREDEQSENTTEPTPNSQHRDNGAGR